MTVIFAAPPGGAKAALAEYASRPGVTMDRRIVDGYREARQPLEQS